MSPDNLAREPNVKIHFPKNILSRFTKTAFYSIDSFYCMVPVLYSLFSVSFPIIIRGAEATKSGVGNLFTIMGRINLRLSPAGCQ